MRTKTCQKCGKEILLNMMRCPHCVRSTQSEGGDSVDLKGITLRKSLSSSNDNNVVNNEGNEEVNNFEKSFITTYRNPNIKIDGGIRSYLNYQI